MVLWVLKPSWIVAWCEVIFYVLHQQKTPSVRVPCDGKERQQQAEQDVVCSFTDWGKSFLTLLVKICLPSQSACMGISCFTGLMQLLLQVGAIAAGNKHRWLCAFFNDRPKLWYVFKKEMGFEAIVMNYSFKILWIYLFPFIFEDEILPVQGRDFCALRGWYGNTSRCQGVGRREGGRKRKDSKVPPNLV